MSDDFDELASAYLDGETDEEEALRVEGDPGLLDRVEELMRVRLGSLPAIEPDPELRRRHLAAALDVFDGRPVGDRPRPRAVGTPPRTERADPLRPIRSGPDDDERSEAPGRSGGQTGVPPVVELSARRAGSADRMRWLGAVAAGLVVIAGVGVTLSRGGGDDAGIDQAMERAVDDEMTEEEGGAATEDAEESSAMVMSDDAVSSAAADDQEAGDQEAERATAATLLIDPRPDAAVALREAVAAGVVPDPRADALESSPPGGAEPGGDPFGCLGSLGIDRALVAAVLVRSPDEESYLYVFGPDPSGPEAVAVLVDERCDVLSTSP